MKKLLYILIPLFFAYFTVVAGFYSDQQNLVFVPKKNDGTTPQKFGLTDYEDVKFKNPEGQTLDGWWICHQDGQIHPTLLYCHGNAANLSLLSEVSKIFYDFGFDALIFDYRAYGDSEGTRSDLSEKAVDEDAMAAFQWLKNKNIEEKNIIIWGHSLGSSVAAELSTQTHPAGLILEGAFPSIYAVSRARFPWLLIFPFMITDQFNTALYVTERTCPLLEIHGESDTIIPFALGQQVYQAAVDPKQWIPVPNMNHMDFPSLATQYHQQIMDWVAKCEEAAKPN
ncbi:MAG TPA: alpha/beta hydrolase [bacterium]|nr:alpha/beta hydrolase [bacterium]